MIHPIRALKGYVLHQHRTYLAQQQSRPVPEEREGREGFFEEILNDLLETRDGDDTYLLEGLEREQDTPQN